MAKTTTEFKTMTLSECAKFDKDNNLKSKLTGWGIICKDRHERGVSRKQRRLKKAAA